MRGDQEEFAGNHKVTSVTKKAGEMWKFIFADQSQSFEEPTVRRRRTCPCNAPKTST